MPPQFFKDASMNVGINNKFTPRAFSLNFGSNDSNTKVFSKSLPPNVSSNSALDLQKESTTVNSVCLPRVLLDVTADNGASKNDGGKPQTYNVDFLKDKTQGEVIRHGTLNKLGVLPKNQRASGHNNIVDGDDDDIQITDIRDVSVDFSADNKCFDNVTGEKSLYTEKHRSVPEMTYISDESNPSLQFENTSNTSEQSSGGVLLEALYKSQKVCNQLRDKMESANVKIAYQDEKLVSQQNSVENLKLTINKLQDKLNSLRSESQELKDSRRSDNEAIKNTKNECLELSSSLSGYKIELSEFKKRIDYLKQIKQSSNYEISKKNKEISILQQRLDETSGLLSEQKIKTAELERIVSSCREKYDKKIDDYMNNYNTFETKITEDITTAIDRVSRDMSSYLEGNIMTLINTSNTETLTKIDALTDRFMSALDISDSSLSTEVAKVSYSVGEKLLNIKEFITMEISKGELKIHQDLGNFHEENSKIEGCVNSMVEEFRACQSDLRKKSLEGINEIKEDFERLGSIIRNQDQSKVELEKVKESSETLKEQLQELKTTLIEKNFSVENLEKALNAAEDYKSQLEDSNKIKDSEVERLKLILDKKESQAKTMDEKIEKCKTNCESKMRTQLEIHSFIAEERDSFKQIASEMKVTQELLEAKIAEGSKILEERKSIEIQLRDNERNLLARLELLETQNKDFQRKLDNASELKLERPIDIEGHESINDLELTFSSAVIPKSSSIPSLVPKFNAKNTKKIAPNIISQNKIAAKDKILQVSTGPFQPALDLKTQNKSSLKVKRKKKLLDQEDEIESMFDEFDFDQLDNQFPTLPKRYTKRKKGKT